MGMFDFLTDPGKPYEKAEDAWKQAYQQSQQYGMPFFNAGTGQIPFLNNARDMLFDPAKLQAEWSKGYETSPEAQDMLKRSRDFGALEAESMGLGGSSAALENSQRNAGSIMREDRQRYMNDLMQKFMNSIGIGQNMFGVGANAGAQLGEGALRSGENMAKLAYNKANAPYQMWGNVMGNLFGSSFNPYGQGGGSGGGLAKMAGAMGGSPGTGVY